MALGHENLRCYGIALRSYRSLQSRRWPAGSAWLKDQGIRAAGSVVLNIAEGDGRRGKARLNHFRIALGSTQEVAAVVDMAFPEDESLKQELRRCAGMLRGLLRRG